MGDEDGRHGLVERSAVHVDGGADRQHEADDASVDVVVLQEALEGDRQSGRAAAGYRSFCRESSVESKTIFYTTFLRIIFCGVEPLFSLGPGGEEHLSELNTPKVLTGRSLANVYIVNML